MYIGQKVAVRFDGWVDHEDHPKFVSTVLRTSRTTTSIIHRSISSACCESYDAARASKEVSDLSFVP